MEHAADTAEAAVVDHYFSSSTENIFVPVYLPDTGKQTDDCFVMRRRSPSRGAVQILQLHTHPFKGPFFGTTQVSRYQKGKTNQDFTEATDNEWQWHQLGHYMQVCTSLQTDNHTSTPPFCFYRPDALPAAQPTASKH